MNDTIVYRPFQSHRWPLFIAIPVGILAFCVAGYCLHFSYIGVLSSVGIGIICVWLTKFLYDSSNVAVSFEQTGLRIMGGSYKNYRYISWETLTYGYYARSFKGHLFLVLSPNVLTPEEVKKFANRAANSSRICIDYVTVIYIDFLQNISQLRDFIDDHVLHVSR